MRIPDFTNRKPDNIITERLFFDSAGFVYRGLSWWDYAKRNGSAVALQYAALETRHAIEQLLFEQLIMSVGGQLNQKKYEKCKGNSTKLAKIIRQLSPNYLRLVSFTKAILSLIPNSPPLIEWDHGALLKHWGTLSGYLHWAGEPRETFNSSAWFVTGLEEIEHVATYLWDKMTKGYSGVMMPQNMQPEIRQAWEEFSSGKIALDTAIERARIALPVLSMRTKTSRCTGSPINPAPGEPQR